MTISDKVSNLLGINQKPQSNVLSQALSPVIETAPVGSPTGAQPQTLAKAVAAKLENLMDVSPKKGLELDFMAEPLTEIGAAEAQHTEQASGALADNQLKGLLPTFERSSAKTTAISTENSNSQTAPVETNLPETAIHYESPAQNSASTGALSPELALAAPALTQTQSTYSEDAVNTALAQAWRGQTETGVFVVGKEGVAVESSDSFFKIIGFNESEQLSCKTYSDLLKHMSVKANLDPEKAKRLYAREIEKMLIQISAGEYKSYNWNTLMKTGETIKFQTCYTPNGYLIVTAQDVTEQVERNRLLRVGLEIGTSGYWSYSFTTKQSVLSDYITDKLSPTKLKLANEQGFLSLIHADDAKAIQAEFETCVRDLKQMDCFFRLDTEKSGIRHMRLIGKVETSPVSGEVIAFVAFINDVTDDKRQREELHAVREASKHKSEFLARMSHEIKTPLNAIVGMTDALRDEVESEDARETASFIADAAESLNAILSQTLEHERLMTTDINLDIEEADIVELCQSTLAMWKKPTKDKGLSLKFKAADTLPARVSVDTSRLRQCITNLISNAVKFTETGSISLVVTPINLESPSPRLVIAVKDTGIGMSPAAVDNIFKPFRQGDDTIQRRFGGAGLGMSITHQIISAMNGDIKVQSTEGEGTTIILSIPLLLSLPSQSNVSLKDVAQNITEEKPEAVETVLPLNAAISSTPAVHLATEESAKEEDLAKPPSTVETLGAEVFHPSPPAPQDISSGLDAAHSSQQPQVHKNISIEPSNFKGFDVLVVEDNPINQAVVRKLLSKYINKMGFAFHGQEALDILETQSFDVILMDIHMPVKDGIETTLEIRNSGKPWADTVIVALTADPDFQQKRVCRNIGMNDALAKPVKRQELLDILQKVLDDRKAEENKDDKISA